MNKRRKPARKEPADLREEDTRQEEDPESIDPQVKDIFDEAQDMDYGREDLARKLQIYTDRTPELTGGDIDASWEYADVGEETVGGQNPTPDQSVVEDAGEGVGLTYQDNEPLAVDDKLGDRDREPWELNPASTPDYPERVREEFSAPLETLGISPVTSNPAPKQRRQTRQRHSESGARTMSAGSTKPKRRNAKGKATGTRSAKGKSTAKTRSAGSQKRSEARRSHSSKARRVRR